MTLPDGWVWTTIGEIINFTYGKGLRADRRDPRGSFDVFGSNGIVGKHNEFLIDKPCLIIGRKGAAGQVHISYKPCWPIDTTYYVIPSNYHDLRFLYYLLSSLNLGSLDRSTAIPGLNRFDAYKIRIPLPPLAEQERIVARIEELFTQLEAGVAGLKRAQAALKRYKASVLKAACEGQLVPQDPNDEQAEELLRRMGKRPLDRDDLPGLPEGWRWARLGDIFHVAIGGTPSRSKVEYWKGEIPWVSSSEVANSHIKNTREKISTDGLKCSNAKLYPIGTVLCTRQKHLEHEQLHEPKAFGELVR